MTQRRYTTMPTRYRAPGLPLPHSAAPPPPLKPSPAPKPKKSGMSLRAWARTPKGLLLLLLTPLALWAAFGPGLRVAVPGLVAGTATAAAVDLVLMRWQLRRWVFPDGALLTGLLVAMVLSSHEPWTSAAIAAAIAILGKRIIRSRYANIFNPAAFGLVASFYLLHTGQDWWGAMTQLPVWTIAAVFATGLFIANRINKLPMVLSFLGIYFALAAIATFPDAAGVSELFRYPDAPAALFFALFILTDPPTSPTRHRDQIVVGSLVALVAFGLFEFVGSVYYLLGGVLAGNLWEAARRWLRDHHRISKPHPTKGAPAEPAEA